MIQICNLDLLIIPIVLVCAQHVSDIDVPLKGAVRDVLMTCELAVINLHICAYLCVFLFSISVHSCAVSVRCSSYDVLWIKMRFYFGEVSSMYQRKLEVIY